MGQKRLPESKGMSSIVIAAARPATLDDVSGVARVMSRSLGDDPFFQWLFPEVDSHMAKTRRFFAQVAGFGYVPHGDTRVTESAASPSDNSVIRGAALWAPPESNPEGRLVSLRNWPHWVPLLGRDRIAAFLRIFAEWKLAAPQEPHLYLAALGVDPAFAGQGVASTLLTDGLDRADSQGVPVFTQTLDPEHIAFYERFGFEVVREVEHLEGGTSYFLLRG